MSNYAWIITIVLILTALGALTLTFITLKYYWGERGTPPLTGSERKRQQQEELKLRAAQIEHSQNHPRETRRPDFWNNQKVAGERKRR